MCVIVTASISCLCGKAKGKATIYIKDCVYYFEQAIDLLSDSLDKLREIAAGKVGDFKFAIFEVRSTMSGASTYQTTCTDEFVDGPLKKKVLDLVAESKKFTYIAA